MFNQQQQHNVIKQKRNNSIKRNKINVSITKQEGKNLSRRASQMSN
jgi:hypothetical protein